MSVLRIENYKGVKKMKKVLGFGSVAVACLLLLPVVGNAQSATQEADVSVVDGDITLKTWPNLKLNFEDIALQDYKDNKLFYGILTPSSYTGTICPDNHHPSYNPYGEVLGPSVLENPYGRDAIVRVENYKTKSPEFKVVVQRSGFFHKDSGEEMIGVHLYMGRFMDTNDYQEANRSTSLNYNPNDIEGRNKYWLANSLTIKKGESVLVADYRGTSGLGEHSLSPFRPSFRAADGTIPERHDLYREKYTEKNISLGVDYAANIPTTGAYATTLTWSIEQTP